MLPILALVSLAQAGHGRLPPPFWEDDGHTVTVSVSPLHLMVPMLEVTAEFRASDTRSWAVIGGIGRGNGEPYFDVGGQLREYVIGDFDDGLNLGAEVIYSNLDWYGRPEHHIGFGPFVGAKLTLSLFTVELQGGGHVIIDREDVGLAPLVNFTTGVSF